MARCALSARFARRRSFAAAASAGGGQAFGKDRFAKEIGQLHHKEELFTFFRSNRELLAPPHICLLLERLASGVPTPDGDAARAQESLEAKRALFNTAEFMQLMKDSVRKLEKFSAQELPRLLAVLESIRWSDKVLFRIAEPLVVRHLPAMTTEDLPHVVKSFVGVRCGSQVLYEEVVHRYKVDARQMDAATLAAMVAAFSNSPHKPRAFLAAAVPLVATRLKSFDARQLANVVHAYAYFARDLPPFFVARLFRLLQGPAGQLAFEKLSPREAVSVLRALALWSRVHGRSRAFQMDLAWVFVAASAPLLTGGVSKLPPEEAAHAFWSVAKVKAKTPELFVALYERVVKVAHRLGDASLAACLLASARVLSSLRPGSRGKDAVGHPLRHEDGTTSDRPGGWQVGNPERPEPLCDQRLLDASESHVQKNAAGFKPRELTSVVLAYSMTHAGSAELYGVLQRACHEKSREMPGEQLASVLWSFATVRLGPSLFQEMQFDVLERVNQLAVPAICDILWAYCVVRHYDPHFFKALLSTLNPSKIEGDPRCALLCPALMDLRVKLPDMDPVGLERYAGYARGVFRRQQLAAAAPEEERRHIAEAVAAAGMECQELADVDGYIVDVLVTAPESNEGAKPVALLYHSPRRTLHLRTNEPLGQAMMRHRHLRNQGFGVVNVWDRSWDSLELDDRVDFLRARVAGTLKQGSREQSSHL